MGKGWQLSCVLLNTWGEDFHLLKVIRLFNLNLSELMAKLDNTSIVFLQLLMKDGVWCAAFSILFLKFVKIPF